MGLHRFIPWSVIKVQNIRISLYIKHTGLVFLLTSPYYWDCTVLVGLNSFIVKDITLMLCCISNALTHSAALNWSILHTLGRAVVTQNPHYMYIILICLYERLLSSTVLCTDVHILYCQTCRFHWVFYLVKHS